MSRRTYTYDDLLEMKASAAVTATAVESLIIDTCSTTSYFNGTVVIDVSAIDVTTGDENYIIHVQGSSSATFASDIVNLATLELGDGNTGGADVVSGTGRYELKFGNEIPQNGTTYRYLRLSNVVAGTSPSITYAAFAARDAGVSI